MSNSEFIIINVYIRAINVKCNTHDNRINEELHYKITL